MEIIDPGHRYKLNVLDEIDYFVELVFVKREGKKYPGNIGHYPGTNLQEVIRACIDRLKYLDNQIYDRRNEMCITLLKTCLFMLEQRASERHNRILVVSLGEIESYPTCDKCGHIGCNGECHA